MVACDGRTSGAVALPPVTLAMAFRPAKVMKYHFHLASEVTSDTGGGPIPVKTDLTATETITVRAVGPNGTADIDVLLDGTKLTVNDIEVELPQSSVTSKLRISRDGEILTGGVPASSSSGSPNIVPGLDQVTPLLPDHAVKPGDRWAKTYDRPVPYGDGKLHYSTDNKFLRYEQVKGVKAAVIETSSAALPLTFSLDVRKLLQAGGQAGLLSQFPPKSQPKISYVGSGSLDLLSTMDPKAGEMLKAHLQAKFDLKTAFLGFPKGSVPAGEVPQSGKLILDLDRV
jgi:hypothetical protein